MLFLSFKIGISSSHLELGFLIQLEVGFPMSVNDRFSSLYKHNNALVWSTLLCLYRNEKNDVLLWRLLFTVKVF